MKIGIVTITELDNFGNRLQNYALQRVLMDLGLDVETIPNYIVFKYRKSKRWRLNQLKKGIRNKDCSVISPLIRQIRFEKFDKKHFAFSNNYSDINHISKCLNEEYDYFIAGSDQIWNPYFTFNLDFNFLTFCDKHKRLAYAASFGVDEIPEEKVCVYREYINGIDQMSVREYSGKKIVKLISGKDVPVLVDPTILLDREQWKTLSKKPKWIRNAQKYILLYYLGKTEERDILIKELLLNNPKMKECKILDINDIKKLKEYSVRPDEFIWLIDNSQAVITDSFHGTVFSILMGVPFIHSPRKDVWVSMNSRVSSLFKKLELNELYGEIYTDHIINNATLEKKLNECRLESIHFLRNALFS